MSRHLELSIDENNYPAAVRDAIFDAMPEQCHGCDEAFERSYRIGQQAVREQVSPEQAAEWAWGNIGVCCRDCVQVDEVPLESVPSQEKVLVDA